MRSATFSAVGKTPFERRGSGYPHCRRRAPGDKMKKGPPPARLRLNHLRIDRYKHQVAVTAVTDLRVYGQYIPRTSTIELGPSAFKVVYRGDLGNIIAHEFAHHLCVEHFNEWADRLGIKLLRRKRWAVRTKAETYLTYGLSNRGTHEYSVLEEYLAESGALAMRLMSPMRRQLEPSTRQQRRAHAQLTDLLQKTQEALLPGALAWLSCFKAKGVRIPPAMQRHLRMTSSGLPSKLPRTRETAAAVGAAS
jgi:hypothetical protein